MKGITFRFTLFCLILFGIVHPSLSQTDSHSSNTGRPWYYPDHAVGQFAGNIGFLSAGVGYSYLGDHVQSDLIYGIAPSSVKGGTVHMLTIKTDYWPVQVQLSEEYTLVPFRIGMGVSYTIGPHFETWWANRYPDDYYWFTTSLRLTPHIGASLSRSIGSGNTVIKRLEVFAELGTHDLAIASYASNKDLTLWQITNIGLGVKAIF
jgi:hypothetical protein